MTPAELQQENALLRNETRALVASELNSSGEVVQVFRKTELLLGGALRRNRVRFPDYKEACGAGCSHCCFQILPVSISDVAAALEHIRSHFSPVEVEALKARAGEYEHSVGPSFGLNYREVRAQCPFLVDDVCSIYEARPLACRAVNSQDASVCEQIKLQPDIPLVRPSAPNQPELFRAVQSGLVNGLSSFGLFNKPLDFGRAIAIALDQPDAVQDFVKGGDVFAQAILRAPTAEKPKLVMPEQYYAHYQPGEEPAGKLVASDLIQHFQKLDDGEIQAAVNELSGPHPVNLIRKIVVPYLYRSESEVEDWRARFQQAVQGLGEAKFDPREAFDALGVLETFGLAYQQCNDREILSELGDILVNQITGAALPDLVEPIAKATRSGPTKVGYISENLSSSNGGTWARGWIKNHGPNIESHAICLRDQLDSVSLEFKRYAKHFHHLTGNVPANARFIKSLGLDVLIYTDIGMSGRNYQYATMRLAPVQCTAWGHPITSGLPTIDYYLSSDLMEPENAQDHYREKLVRLPNSGLCYPRYSVPPLRMAKEDFGLDGGPLYLSCQNPMKYLPRWDFIYREICERTGRPIVFVEGQSPLPTHILGERMRAAGINAKWLPGLGSADFLNLIRVADVCLDTPGWNGGNTTIQALAEGRPVVTLPGEFMRGRHGLAFARIANAPGLVTANAEGFIDLSCDLDRCRAAMRNSEPGNLFEDKKPVQAQDSFFENICP